MLKKLVFLVLTLNILSSTNNAYSAEDNYVSAEKACLPDPVAKNTNKFIELKEFSYSNWQVKKNNLQSQAIDSIWEAADKKFNFDGDAYACGTRMPDERNFSFPISKNLSSSILADLNALGLSPVDASESNLNIYKEAINIWIQNEVNNLNSRNIIKRTANQLSQQCSIQGLATKNNLADITKTVDLFEQMINLQTNNNIKAEKEKDLKDLLVNIINTEVGLKTWIEKLPFYSQRNPECKEYPIYLKQSKDLLIRIYDLKNTINSKTPQPPTKTKDKFSEKEFDALLSASQKQLSDAGFKVQKSIWCSNNKALKQVVGLNPKCPKGYKKAN
jgi:hypothetical protein